MVALPARRRAGGSVQESAIGHRPATRLPFLLYRDGDGEQAVYELADDRER